MIRLLTQVVKLLHNFALVYNVNSIVDRNGVSSYLSDLANEHSATISYVNNVSNAFELAKLGKSCDVDGLAAEHYMYSGNFIKACLFILFISFISQGHLPDSFIKPTTVLLLKVKQELLTTRTIRPISLVIDMSKILLTLPLFEVEWLLKDV